MSNPNPPTDHLPKFKKGQSGNPGGRPVGARVQLENQFLTAIANDFKQFGKAALEACRLKKPDRYIMAVASLMPKQVQQTRPLEGLTDDELRAIAEELRGRIGAQGVRPGDSSPPGAEITH